METPFNGEGEYDKGLSKEGKEGEHHLCRGPDEDADPMNLIVVVVLEAET